MSETGEVRANEVNYSTKSGGIIGILLSIFFNMKVYCVFSLESPHRVYTAFQYQYNKTSPYIIPIIIMSAAMALQNEFEIAVVNEPSMFEPPKFCCTRIMTNSADPDHHCF